MLISNRGHINSLSVPDYIIISIFLSPQEKSFLTGQTPKCNPLMWVFVGKRIYPWLSKVFLTTPMNWILPSAFKNPVHANGQSYPNFKRNSPFLFFLGSILSRKTLNQLGISLKFQNKKKGFFNQVRHEMWDCNKSN